MKLALEAPSGLVSQRPDLLIEALVSIAKSEGVGRCEFLDTLAKATGATRKHQHAEGQSPYRVVGEASEHASFIYESAMTMALAEIMEMLTDHIDSVDASEYGIGGDGG